MTSMNFPSAPQKPKLLDRVREAIRYRKVLQQDLPWLEGVVRAKRPIRLPVVLTREEVRAVLAHLRGTPLLLGTLLYGAGLRLLPACRARGAGRECAQLRRKDVDFSVNQILVRNRKGQKDRVTLLPATVKADLDQHLKGIPSEPMARRREIGAAPCSPKGNRQVCLLVDAPTRAAVAPVQSGDPGWLDISEPGGSR